MNTLSIILEECTIDKHWCFEIFGTMFDELIENYENSKTFAPETFIIIKIISLVSTYIDSEELHLTKKILNFIFQSLSKMSYENSHVSISCIQVKNNLRLFYIIL